MPELPEVETIVRSLSPRLAGRTATGAEVLWPKTVQGDRELLETLPGARLSGITRRAKLALFQFEPDLILAFHLKMSGALLVKPGGEPPGSHVRLVLRFAGGLDLHFADSRKFGYCRLERTTSLSEWAFYRDLGPEPLEMSSEEFESTLAGRNRAVKALLLDQTVIAGVGNIYADESLHAAGILPSAPASGLAPASVRRLHAELQRILACAIEGCGTSFRNYLDAEGRPGSFQNELLVYGRGGEPCLRCGKLLNTAKIAGRTTVYCPGCQKKR